MSSSETDEERPDTVASGAVVASFPRSQAGEALGIVASKGSFVLQQCANCGKTLYPSRDACPVCWGGELKIAVVPDGGQLVAATELHHSNSPYFRKRLPWRIGMVKLDCGPMALAHVHADVAVDARVRLTWRNDSGGNSVMVALPDDLDLPPSSDPRLEEL